MGNVLINVECCSKNRERCCRYAGFVVRRIVLLPPCQASPVVQGCFSDRKTAGFCALVRAFSSVFGEGYWFSCASTRAVLHRPCLYESLFLSGFFYRLMIRPVREGDDSALFLPVEWMIVSYVTSFYFMERLEWFQIISFWKHISIVAIGVESELGHLSWKP